MTECRARKAFVQLPNQQSSMDEDYHQFPTDLFRIDQLTPIAFGNGFQQPAEQCKLIREEIVGKKGKSKGLKNDGLKSKKPKEQQDNSGLKKGHWGTQENKRYHWFLELHNKHFINKHLRRMDKIFKTMSTFVGTREAEQCRSHHQKMEKKYRTFFKILHHLRTSCYGTTSSAPVQAELDAAGLQLIDELPEGNLLEKNLNLSEGSILQEIDQQPIQANEEVQNLPNEIEESFRPENLFNEDCSKDFMRGLY